MLRTTVAAAQTPVGGVGVKLAGLTGLGRILVARHRLPLELEENNRLIRRICLPPRCNTVFHPVLTILLRVNTCTNLFPCVRRPKQKADEGSDYEEF